MLLGEKIVSYLRSDYGLLTAGNHQNNQDFVEFVQSLQCGESIISIVPSLIYLIGIALLVHHIITMNIRPQLYRRVGHEMLLQIPWQEILILMLVYQCIRIWLTTLVLVTTVFNYYQKKLIDACPVGIKTLDSSNMGPITLEMIIKILQDLSKFPLVVFYITSGLAPFNKWINVTDIIHLHPLVQTLLLPRLMKIFVCTCISILPIIALMKLKERRPLPQFMLWMGPIRRDRSELGASSYYLERPVSENISPNSSDSDVKKSNSCGDMTLPKPARPKRFRARKSVSV